jgi:hypothetical protein
MKLYNVLFIIAGSIFSTQPLNNVVNVHNNLNLSQINTASIQQHMSNVLMRAQDMLDEKRKDCVSLLGNTLDYIMCNKKRSCIYSLATAYVGIIAALWILQIKINKGYWKNWKKEMSIESMFSIKQQDLAHQLLLDIQIHYINPLMPTDTTEPISKFIVDLAQEEEYIQKYLDLIGFLERIHVARFIYFKTEKVKYEEYATRISCLKGLFAIWLSEYKMAVLHNKAHEASNAINA